ncbi:MAG: arylesterase [Gammaproteobacteria bacterium]|nr:arylesterase [Gammaproteobacteria bacterium]
MKKFTHLFLCAIMIFFLQACHEAPQPKLSLLSKNAVILAFGDSLTYGTGTSPNAAYPAVLQKMTGLTVINAGVPGEETRDSRNRIGEELEKYQPDLVIVCLGGNDFIRKRDPASVKENLVAIIQTIKKSGAQVILVAVPDFKLSLAVPPLYSELGTELKVPVDEHIIADLEGKNEMKSDYIHFNAEGYRLLAENIAAFLKQQHAL